VRRSIWIVGSLVVAAGVYVAAWFQISEQTRAAMEQWAAGLPADRASVELGEMHRSGFPFAVRWTLSGPRGRANWVFGDVSAIASSVSVAIEIWRPNVFKVGVVGLVADGTHQPSAQQWRAAIDLGTVSVLARDEGAVEALFEFTAVEVGVGTIARMERSAGRAEQLSGAVRARGPTGPGARDPRYELAARLKGVSTPYSDQAPLEGDGTASLEATLSGNPGDASLEDFVAWRDSGGVLDVKELEVSWRPVELAFDGTITLDERLRPLGAGTADLRGLDAVIDWLVMQGRLTGAQASGTKIALALMTRPAKDGGEPVVRLPLTAQDGRLKAGPFVVARLPSLVR